MENLDKYMRPQNSPASGTANQFVSALAYDNTHELNPLAQPYFVSKGTVNTIAGGVLNLYDKTGGTKILTYNPTTGVVTILGSLIAQSVATGTYTNITLAGTNLIAGTLQNGVVGTALVQGGTIANATIGTPNLQNGTVGTTMHLGGTIANAFIGTPQLNAGTVNASTYQTLGTVGATGTGIYVKTIDFAGSTSTLGTVIIKNGLVIAIN